MNSIRSKTDQDKYPDLQQLHSLFQVKMLLHTFLNFLILCFSYFLYFWGVFVFIGVLIIDSTLTI